MAGPYLLLRVELGPAVEGAWVATVGPPWSILVAKNSPVAGRDNFPIGRVSGSGLSRAWIVFEPPPPPATARVGPGNGIRVGTECLLSCDALTPVQSQPHVCISRCVAVHTFVPLLQSGKDPETLCHMTRAY